MTAANQRPYELRLRFPMSVAAHELTDRIVALSADDRATVLAVLLAFERLGGIAKVGEPELFDERRGAA